MRYIQTFSTSGDVQTAIDNGSLGKPYVAYVESDGAIDWNTKFIDYAKMPLTFEIISGGTIVFTHSDNSKTVYYSLNGSEYQEYTSSKGGTVINVNAGDIVKFKGNVTAFGYNSGTWFGNTTAKHNIYGNIFSLLYGDEFIGKTELPSRTIDNFSKLFKRSHNLYDTSNLVLPATTLTQGCYYEMFVESENVKYIKCLATDISASNCTKNWLYRSSSTGTFVKRADVNWPTGSDGIPSGWTVVEE